jgi:hypothetical protein
MSEHQRLESGIKTVTDKWRSILGIEAALFAINDAGKPVLLMLFSGAIVDLLTKGELAEALALLHSDLKDRIGDMDIRYSKSYLLVPMNLNQH